MGKVESIQVDGLDLLFYSNEPLSHPPHFHAERRGEWGVKVYFLECTSDHLEYEVKWPPTFSQIPRKYRKELLRLIVDTKAELLEEYTRKTCLD